MRRARASWIIVIAVALLTLAVPALRHQVLVNAAAPRWWAGRPDPAAFVTRHHISDPDLLLAAGAWSSDRALLQRAAALGADSPVWPISTSALLAQGIPSDRIGTAGFDPEDTAAIRAEVEEIEKSGVHPLTATQAAPILDALHGWERADPTNGLPLAVESYLLYTLHRDREALRLWQEAGRRPLATCHEGEIQRATERLFRRMGAPVLEASFLATGSESGGMHFHGLLRSAARMSLYEGRLAQMHGRPREALAWWNGCVGLGEGLQRGADTLVEWLVGDAIEGIGASPAWHLEQSESYTFPPHPHAWSYWYGTQHAFYVSQVGEHAAAQLLQRQLLRTARGELVSTQYLPKDTFYSLGVRASSLSRLAMALALTSALLLLLFALVSAARRPEADAAGAVKPGWKLLFIAPTVLTAAAAVATVLAIHAEPFEVFAPFRFEQRADRALFALVFAAAGVPLLALLFVRFTRRAPAGWVRVWRGNMRACVPIAVAFLWLAFLSVTAVSIPARRAADRAVSTDEMTRLHRFLGAAWDHPTLPADAWHAAYPKPASVGPAR